MESSQPDRTVDLEIKRAAQLSITEICIGSIGHALKIPLTGQVLSLNQLAYLLNAVNKDKLPKSSVFEISGIAAILKSFSPAGQKLGPMLSIAMQGFLFWICVSVVGLNILGQIAGAILLSLWAFAQPIITLFMIYGFDLIKLVDFYILKLNRDYSFIASSLVYGLTLLIVLKLTIAVVFVIYSISKKKEISIIGENKISAFVMQQIPNGPNAHPFKSALKDLFKPLFLFSFILMLIFVWQIEGSTSQKIWFSLRPLAIAFSLFYLLRSSWVTEKMIAFSKKSKTFERIYLKSKSSMNLMASKATRKD